MIPLVLFALVTQAAAPHRDTRAVTTTVATGSLTGIVTSDEAQPRPLRRARVTISGGSLEVPRTAITGDDGAFAFGGLPVGRYTLQAAKDGYVSMAYGATRPGRPGASVVVTDRPGQIALRLPRGGVVTGTVVDVDGQPAAGLNVTVLGRRFLGSALNDYSYAPAGAPPLATTDDRGMYRIYGLPAGDYIIAVQPVFARGGPLGTGTVVQMMSDGSAGTRTMRLSQVFHPAATGIGRASRVTVRAGEERIGIDVQLEYVPLAAVSGTASLPAGAGPARVTLWQLDELTRPQSGPVATVDNTGRFHFPAVAPGHYRLAARTMSAGRSEQQGSVHYATADVAVNGEDVEVALATQPALAISGSIAFESDRLGSPVLPAGFRANLPALPANGGWPLPAIVLDGRHFRMDGVVPGLYRLSGNLQGIRTPIGPWWLKSLTGGGRELLDTPLDIRQSIDDAVATFTDRASEVSGTVTDAGGPIAAGFAVAFAVDRTAWFFNSRRIAGVRLDREGRYAIRNLPPGEYRLVATRDLESNEWFDPSVLDALLPASAPLRIGGPEKLTVDLVIR